MPYIYKITNLINNKMYIGKTNLESIEKRWKEHRHDASKSYRASRPLYKAINKYGFDNFKIELIETVETDKIACEREEYWIKHFNTYVGFENSNGYNATLGGDGTAYIDYDDKEICDAYEKLERLSEVTKKYNIDMKTARKILKRNNVQILPYPRPKPVAQIDIETNEIIEIYKSLSNAKKKYPKIARDIDNSCRCLKKHAGGYKWSFVEDLPPEAVDTYYKNKK